MPSALQLFGRSPGLVSEVARRAQKWLGWKGPAEFDVEQLVQVGVNLCDLNRPGLRSTEPEYYLAYLSQPGASSVLRFVNRSGFPQRLDQVYGMIYAAAAGNKILSLDIVAFKTTNTADAAASAIPENEAGDVLPLTSSPFVAAHLGVDVPPPAGTAQTVFYTRQDVVLAGQIQFVCPAPLVIPPDGEVRCTFSGNVADTVGLFAHGQAIEPVRT